MKDRDKKHFRRILLKKTAGYLGGGLVACALVGGLYGDHLHFAWALCTAGVLFIACAWFGYLAEDPTSLVSRLRRPEKKKVPYALQGRKDRHRAKPAFARDGSDFDDDLVPFTSVDEDALTDKERSRLSVLSRCAAGLILIALSYLL